MSIKAIVVGTGVGCRVHVPALKNAGFEVVALVDVNKEMVEQRAKDNDIPYAFTDLEEAILGTGASLVTIATPPNTHYPLVMKAIEKGCHVLCEKPFALDSKEAKEMLDAAKKAGIVHRVGHEFRFNPSSVLIKKLIEEGAIGEPRFSTYIGYNGYAAGYGNPPAWWFKPEMGGGWLLASGSHDIDKIRSQMGEFKEVSATLHSISPKATEVDDSFIVRYTLKNGMTGIIQSTGGAIGDGSNSFRVSGTKGTICLDKNDVVLSNGIESNVVSVPDDIALEPFVLNSNDPRFETLEWKILAPIEVPPCTLAFKSLKAEIEGEESNHQGATFEDGYACMKVIDAIRESSSKNGAAIEIK